MTRSSTRNVGALIASGLFLAWSVAPPASAQALGDADCPGGYSYNRAYHICVPYGWVYVPQYAPEDYGYAPPIYGPSYIIIQQHDRDDRRRRDRDRDHDRHDDRR
jgi:hypothetical protein